jgi:hypothetical protein
MNGKNGQISRKSVEAGNNIVLVELFSLRQAGDGLQCEDISAVSRVQVARLYNRLRGLRQGKYRPCQTNGGRSISFYRSNGRSRPILWKVTP